MEMNSDISPSKHKSFVEPDNGEDNIMNSSLFEENNSPFHSEGTSKFITAITELIPTFFSANGLLTKEQ